MPTVHLPLHRFSRCAAAAALAVGVLGSALAAVPAGLDQLVAAPGLQRVQSPAFDVAYVLPGASLAGYQRVAIEPVQVQFRAGWNPRRSGSHLPLSSADREQLQARVAQWAQGAFAQELVRGGLQAVQQAGAGVLVVRPRLVDVWLNDPATVGASPTRVYTSSSGEATLVLELADGATGQVLARLGDHEELRPTSRLLRISDTTRLSSDIESVAGDWGRQVRALVAPAR